MATTARERELTAALRGLLDGVDYLRSGGALESLSHAPDGGATWHRAERRARVALGLPVDEDDDE